VDVLAGTGALTTLGGDYVSLPGLRLLYAGPFPEAAGASATDLQ